MDEEYEIIPTSPLRRLEQRMSKMESSSSTSEVQRLIEQIIELIKANQRIIDDVIKSDAELRNEISKIPAKIDQLLSNMNTFIDMIKASAVEDVPAFGKETFSPIVKKLDELIDHNKKSVEANQAALSNLGMIDKRLKRMYMQMEGPRA